MLGEIVVDSRSLATLVRERRKELGLTQLELAELSEVSPRFVYDLERGKPTVSMELVHKVVATLGLEMTLAVRVIPE
jgi:HTH-type transcriptional regulator / antitoxin HipB